MIKTDRLYITKFKLDMVEAVHLNSLDEDNRKFNPNEVFETMEDAQEIFEGLDNGNYKEKNKFFEMMNKFKKNK